MIYNHTLQNNVKLEFFRKSFLFYVVLSEGMFTDVYLMMFR